MRRGWPRHPVRVAVALMLAGCGGAAGFPLNVVFVAGALHVLWDL